MSTPLQPGMRSNVGEGSPGSEALRRLIHDLNNFLGIILGNSELLLDQAALDPKSARRTQHIHQAAIKARDAIVLAQAEGANGD